MDATNNIANDLFYKIRSRFSGLKLGTAQGLITINPEEARFFDFDYKDDDAAIGHVSISLAEENSMKVYFSTGITESMDDRQKRGWYGFLKELRLFAKRRLMAFDTRDIAKDNLDKRDYAFLSQNSQSQDKSLTTTPVGESTMNESQMYGTKTVSYQKLLDTRLIIRHSKALVDDQQPGARARNISALFVENQEGERFKYPFIHLAGARAMQRHVGNSGLPYDEVGRSIISMSEEIAQLKSFGNYVVRNDLMNSDTNDIVSKSQAKLESLREQMTRLSKQAYYEQYKANFQESSPVEIPQSMVEDFKEKFTVRSFKEDIATVFPVLYRLMKEGDMIGYDDIVAMSEADLLGEADMDFGDKTEELSMWLDKYDGYRGMNGDALPMGWIKAMTSTGIVSDGYEQDEFTAFEKKTGKKESEWEDAEWDEFTKPKNSPITSKMFDDLAKIIGTDDRDEDVARAVSSALGISENIIGYDDIVAMTTEDINDTADIDLEEENGSLDRFEDWIMGLGESSPIQSNEEQILAIKNLNKLTAQAFPAGADGLNAVTSLKGIIDDPKLYAEIKDAAKTDPQADARPMVKAWLEKSAPEVASQIDFGDMAEEPAATDPAAPEAAPEPAAAQGDDAEATAGDAAVAAAVGQDQMVTQGDDPDERNKDRDDDLPFDADDDVSDTDEFGNKIKHRARHLARKGMRQAMDVKEVAEFINSFYDRGTNTFPKGPEGVVVMVGKKFGEQAESVARKFVERMAPDQEHKAERMQELTRMRELAGMPTQQGMAEGYSTEVEKFFEKVAQSGEYDMLHSAQDNKYGPDIQKAVQDMYDDISIDNGFHPDDDFEEIYDRMLDNIEADHGSRDSKVELEHIKRLSGISQGLGY